jgi:hypothetical protein
MVYHPPICYVGVKCSKFLDSPYKLKKSNTVCGGHVCPYVRL